MQVSRKQVVAALAVALAATGVVAVQAPADAAFTTSTITSPANGTRWQIKDSVPEKSVTVTGTTNGTTGDTVDIRCYEIGSSTWSPGANSVAVQANGHFSTSMLVGTAYGSCRLRAVPHGYAKGASITAFHGPTVTTEWVTSDKASGGPNDGKTYDHYMEFQSPRALNDFGSATGPGYWDSRLAFADGSSSNYLWYGNADLGGSRNGRNAIKIDGRNAYGPDSAHSIFPNDPGAPKLSFTVSRSTKTGNITIVEQNPLVLCPLGAPYDPSAVQCQKFVPSGILLERTIQIVDGGLQVRVRDTWRSTDAKAHYVSAYYGQEVEGRDGTTNSSVVTGLKLPWIGKFTTYDGEVVSKAPTADVSTIYYRDNNAAAQGNALFPRGAVTFNFRPKVDRYSNTHLTLQLPAFQVKAGSSKVTEQDFVMGTTDEGVAAKAAANEDRLN